MDRTPRATQDRAKAEGQGIGFIEVHCSDCGSPFLLPKGCLPRKLQCVNCYYDTPWDILVNKGSGIIDVNGVEIKFGDWLQTMDKDGIAWIGQVGVEDPRKRIKGAFPQFVLITNFRTWLHQEQGLLYEVVDWIEEI